MPVDAIITRCHILGITLNPGPGGKLRVSPPGVLTDELREELKWHKAEILSLLRQQQASAETLQEEHVSTSRVQLLSPTPSKPLGDRAFLSCPLGQADNPAPWDAWAPFFDWLREHHPDRFHAVCEAEESIRALEQQGIAEGPEYEQACAELLWRFEEARRLKLKESVKVWM